jgi:NitT/TauT family transport system substrate-binding protein
MRAAAAFLLLALGATAAHAEPAEIRIARQTGIGYLQLHVAQELRLIEKHAREAGLGDVKVTYQIVTSPAAMNDMLIGGQIDLVGGGLPPSLVIADRTRGNLDVRNLAALGEQPLDFNTNNPALTRLEDLTERDRIALPAVKVSTQAILLQMAAEAAFGRGQHERLDPITVGLGHPEAAAALIAGRSEITVHFASAPFTYQERERPGIRRLFSSYDIVGGPMTTTNAWMTGRFYNANPKTARAIYGALAEATELINRDHAEAARIYLKLENAKLDPVFVEKMLADPETAFTLKPQRVFKIADFLHRIGTLKAKPADWRDFFFPIAQQGEGS